MPCKFQLRSWMWLSTSLTSKRYSFHLWCLFHLLLSPSLSDIRQQRAEPPLTFRTGAQLRSAINLLSVSVCLAACQCAHVGNNCDANTGQCICPPNTVGERCDKCAPNHWGHDISSGCKVRLISPLHSCLLSLCIFIFCQNIIIIHHVTSRWISELMPQSSRTAAKRLDCCLTIHLQPNPLNYSKINTFKC